MSLFSRKKVYGDEMSTTGLSTMDKELQQTVKSLETDRDRLSKLLEELNTKMKNLPNEETQKEK